MYRNFYKLIVRLILLRYVNNTRVCIASFFLHSHFPFKHFTLDFPDPPTSSPGFVHLTRAIFKISLQPLELSIQHKYICLINPFVFPKSHYDLRHSFQKKKNRSVLKGRYRQINRSWRVGWMQFSNPSYTRHQSRTWIFLVLGGKLFLLGDMFSFERDDSSITVDRGKVAGYLNSSGELLVRGYISRIPSTLCTAFRAFREFALECSYTRWNGVLNLSRTRDAIRPG